MLFLVSQSLRHRQAANWAESLPCCGWAGPGALPEMGIPSGAVSLLLGILAPDQGPEPKLLLYNQRPDYKLDETRIETQVIFSSPFILPSQQAGPGGTLTTCPEATGLVREGWAMVGLPLKQELPSSFRMTQSPSFHLLEAFFLDRNQGGCRISALCKGSNQPHSPRPSSPCLSPRFASCSPVPSIQLTTLLLLSPSQMGTRCTLDKVRERNLTQTNQQRKHNQAKQTETKRQ